MNERRTPKDALLVILEQLPVAVVITDPTTGVIAWTNAKNLDLVAAADPANLIGRNILEFIQPEQQAVALRDIEAVVRGETPDPVVYHLKRLDGGRADVQISSVPMRYENNPAMLSLVFDLTEYLGPLCTD